MVCTVREMIELVKDGAVKNIIHASDIHIRTGDLERSRYNEYQEVITDFVKAIPDTEDTVIVLTGDIFHNKGKIEPPGICLAHYLLDELLKKADVLMICGNHDYRQEDPDIPDMIYSMYHRYFEHRVHSKYKAYYLNKTDYYRYKNILFSVLDIRDVLKSYNTSGKVDSLFPPCLSDPNLAQLYKVGLFHGSVTEFNPQWSGYDCMLLGDIHKGFVTKQGSCVWGYAGSLVQQDFGEGFFDHGFLKWNLDTKTADFVHLYNRYGYCTLQCNGDHIYMHVRGKKWLPITEVARFPDKPSIRVLKNSDIIKVREFCEERNIHPRTLQVWNAVLEETMGEVITPEQHLEELNATDKWLEFLGDETFREFIKQPTQLNLPAGEYGDISKKVTERNGKITKAIDEFMNYCSVDTVQTVHLLSMEWAYLMCYGETNYFNFKNIEGQIALLNGKNAMGKSSFLDVICIGLFGDPTKVRQMITGKKYSDKIIHTNKPAKTAPFVKMTFQVNNDVYELYRSFGTQSARENSILQTAAKLYKIEGSKRSIFMEGTTLVDRWVTKTVGSMDAVLMSTMLCQVDLNNFFYLKQEDQKAILDKALQLDKVSLYGKILKEACLGHADILQCVQTAKETVGALLKRDMYDENGLEVISQELEKLYQLRTIYSNYITKKIPGKASCEADYKKAELEWQILELESVDLESYYRLKEKLEQLQKAYSAVEAVALYKNVEELLEKWKGKYEDFLQQEPKCDVNVNWVKQTLADYEKWLQKPTYDFAKVESEFQAIEEKRLQLKVSPAPKWKKRNNVTEEVPLPSKLIDLNEFAYLENASITLPKKKGWQDKKEEYTVLEKALNVMQLAHHDDCSACQANRTYLEKLNSYKLQLEKYLKDWVTWTN